MSDGDIELRICFSFNTACSPSKEVQSLDKRTIVFFFVVVVFFTLYGHDGHLGRVKWIFNTCIVHHPIDASYKIWL